jgi:hypothetical protein
MTEERQRKRRGRKSTQRQRKFTKIKPGLTWLMARGSTGVAGDTSRYLGELDCEEECRDIVIVASA